MTDEIERYTRAADGLVAVAEGWARELCAVGVLAGAAEPEVDGEVLEVRVPVAAIDDADAYTWDHGTGRIAVRLAVRDARLALRVTVETSAAWNAAPDGGAYADATLLEAGLPWSPDSLDEVVELCRALPICEVTGAVSELLGDVGETARHHCWCGDPGRFELADRSFRCERCFGREVARALGRPVRYEPPRWFSDRLRADD